MAGSGDEVKSTEYYRTQSTKVTAESLEETRQMLRLVHECQDAGINTLKELYTQGDKLSRTEEMLDKADSELDRANVRIKNIKKKNDCCCFALVCCCCMKDPDKIKTKKKKKEEAVSVVLSPREPNIIPASLSKRGPSSEDNSQKGRFFNRVTGETEEDQIEDNLSLVSDHVSVLKQVAIGMNTEVTTHNEQIDRLNKSAETFSIKLEDTTKVTTSILNDGGFKPIFPSHCCCTIC